MPKRCANIHKRKDNRWEGRVKVGKYPNGATKYYSVYGKTYSEAKEKMDAVKLNGVAAQKSVSSTYTFSDVVEMWLSYVKIRLKQSTIYRYKFLIGRHILPMLGGYKITDIKPSVLFQSFLFMLSGIRPRCTQRILPQSNH